MGNREYVPLEIVGQEGTIQLTALKDTGNTLVDQLTGESILICGADVGEELFGLSRERFSDPAEVVLSGLIPGMRLIPYRTVGESAGMMVALRLKGTKINGKVCDPLVAFGPQEIGVGCGYRMLTGGAI